jgi:GNAT superfamily N-acetyltransferase
VSEVRIRDADRARDRKAVSTIDTSFDTSIVFDVVTRPRGIELIERALAKPRVHRYPMADAFAAWSTWDTGWVAEHGTEMCGFAAVEYEAWHGRLVLWHLYVTRTRRREGIARALLARVEDHGRALGAERVWLETTSVNVPGIAAYERLGYAVCGADVTLYDTLPYQDEAAIYLAKKVVPETARAR